MSGTKRKCEADDTPITPINKNQKNQKTPSTASTVLDTPYSTSSTVSTVLDPEWEIGDESNDYTYDNDGNILYKGKKYTRQIIGMNH